MNYAARVGNPERLAQEGGLLGVALDKCTAASDVPPMRKPAPRPENSTAAKIGQTLADGAIVKSCSESAMCRVHRFGSVEGATRFVLACHCSSKST